MGNAETIDPGAGDLPLSELGEGQGAEHHHDEVQPTQGEMPFAIVDGEPVTEPPQDLYIPPDALRVFLEAFQGPLDLLLYLIKRQNIDIVAIPIAEITKQYTQYIELMQDMRLELAGEYLVMAATLAEIKSRMLLPRPADDDDAQILTETLRQGARAVHPPGIVKRLLNLLDKRDDGIDQ